MYDLKNKTEIPSILLIKSERTESPSFNLHRILKIIFEIFYLLFVESELSSTLNTKILKGSEEMDSSIEDSSDSKLDNSDLEFNINILLESENLKNIDNIIEMDVKQFTETLKDIGLS